MVLILYNGEKLSHIVSGDKYPEKGKKRKEKEGRKESIRLLADSYGELYILLDCTTDNHVQMYYDI